MNKINVALAGNPNCGKTTLFNNLTGSNHKIGNWSGVTVEKKVGWLYHNQNQIEVVDLPGTYSLSSRAIDEKIARDYIIGEKEQTGRNHRHRKRMHNRMRRQAHRGDMTAFYPNHHSVDDIKSQPDIIVNIIDASNLERHFYLTTQILEMKIPMVIILNMTDTAKSKGIEINTSKLSEKLNVPVVEMVASANVGIDELKEAIIKEKKVNTVRYNFDEPIEKAISGLSPLLEFYSDKIGCNLRWLCIKVLEKDPDMMGKISKIDSSIVPNLTEIVSELENEMGEDSDILIADGRYRFIRDISHQVQKKKNEFSKTLSDKIDNIVLNRIFGIPIFLLVLFAMFWISTEVASAGIDFMDALFHGGNLLYWDFDGIIPMLGNVVGEGNWLNIILLQGVLGGVGTVLTFLPILFLVFLILSFLEDWGYLSRAATVMDRFMRFIGLPGKAFISFILGFGCTVPAVMSARTLEDPDERWMTIMLVPFMSCGARLPVYVFFGAIFFASWGGALIFLLYLIGLVLAVIIGLILKRWKMKGKEVSTFVIELPSYHIPSIKSVMLTVWKRLTSFLKNAGFVITIIVVILTIMSNVQLYTPKNADEDYEFHPNSKESLLGSIGHGISILFRPLQFGIVQKGENEGETNWRAGVSVFTGLFAKEAIVGTFGALYNLSGEESEAPQLPSIDKAILERAGIEIEINSRSSLKEIDRVISRLNAHMIISSDNRNNIIINEYLNGLEALKDWKLLEGKISNDFDSFSAFLFLLFVLLYTPCIAVIGATYRELGAKWAIFQGLGLFILAYVITLGVSALGGLFIGFA
jgi:ferrous iron transport protein B